MRWPLLGRWPDGLCRVASKCSSVGWNGTWTIEQIKCEIEQHLMKDDPVDVANFAVFWWYQLKKQERLDAEERKISIQSLDKENTEETYLPKM